MIYLSTVGAEYSIKGIAKEILSYKSGVIGIAILLFLIFLSIYTVITIPYDQAIRMWRGEDRMWIENPRNAVPIWYKYIFGKNIPENIAIDSRDFGKKLGIVKVISDIPGTNFKKLYIEFTFTYPYDDFPSEINVFFFAKYNMNAPLLYIYWIKPNNRKIELLSYIVRSPREDILYLSINPVIGNKLQNYIEKTVGEESEVFIPVEMALFAVEDRTLLSSLTAKPLNGVYKVIIEGMLFEKDADIDVRLVVYGKAWGMFGTDDLRRDLLIPILWGTPVAISFGLSASLLISIIHLIIAVASGWYGKWVDSLIQRLTEIYMIIPFLSFLILIATFYKLNIVIILMIIIVLNIFGGGIKSTRALVMQIKNYPYIEAALAYGASSRRIIFLYIIPKILPPMVPGLISSVPGFVFLEAGLSFLGLGDPYLPTWGKVINDAFTGGAMYKGYYYWVLEPSLMLILTALAFAFLGFALDRIVNPKLKEM